jgi:hypothetical protein
MRKNISALGPPPSGVFNHASSRSAISALIPALPLMRRENITRLTLS